jgi:hypothetical protein
VRFAIGPQTLRLGSIRGQQSEAGNWTAGSNQPRRDEMPESPITFTPGQVSIYYAARVSKLKQRGREWRGPCPIHSRDGRQHDDNFAVKSQTGEAFCHSVCGRGWDIIALEMELTGADFRTAKAAVFRLVGRVEPDYRRNGNRTNRNFPKREATKPSEASFVGFEGSTSAESSTIEGAADGMREVARYPYVDRDGKLLFEVVRYLKPNNGKVFRQCRPNGSGVIWNLDGIERVPYRLPKVLNAETVYLPEGEKDVHTLEGWGLVASCNPGGSSNSHLYETWADYFRGRHIVVLPDNDGPGRKHVTAVAAALFDVAASIRIVELPGLPENGDVTDWRDAGGTLEQFREIANAATRLDGVTLARLRAQWRLKDEEPNHKVREESAGDWPKPEPIHGELPPVQAFSEELLPDSLRPLVGDVTDRMQVPMDYAAVVTVLGLAGAVNRRATIQPKANDSSWIVVPNLWGGIVAPPGFMKTPVIQAATRPLNQIQTEWRHEHEEAMKEYARAKEEYELRLAAWKEEFKKASKKGNAPPDRPEDLPEEPMLRPLIVNDATFEMLHETMGQNVAGLLVIRDELTGWCSQLDRAGREAYGVHEPAALYSVSPQFVRLRISDGSLRVRKVSRRILILDDDAVAFFERQSVMKTGKNRRGENPQPEISIQPRSGGQLVPGPGRDLGSRR